jgi:hypothetical protein
MLPVDAMENIARQCSSLAA